MLTLTKMAIDWRKAIYFPPCSDYIKLRLLQCPLAVSYFQQLFFVFFFFKKLLRVLIRWAAVTKVAVYAKTLLIIRLKNESRDTNWKLLKAWFAFVQDIEKSSNKKQKKNLWQIWEFKTECKALKNTTKPLPKDFCLVCC